MQWLVASFVLSVALTVLVNLAFWLFPGLRERTSSAVDDFVTTADDGDRRRRVIVPWKAMLVASLVLTAVVNLVLWLR
jgi:hypothetical protein